MTAAAIAAYWAWWETARPRVEAALRERTLGSDEQLQRELTERGHAVDGGLAWELGGSDGEWTLVLSPEGLFAKRRLTEAWARAAPTHPGWRYLPSREGSSSALGMALRLDDGQDLAFSELRFAVGEDDTRRRVDLRVWHPAFAALDEDDRTRITFLSLDALLGEDAVETWVGAVEPVPAEPEGSIDGKALRACLEDLKESPADQCSMLKGTGPDGEPLFALLQLGLKRMHHLDARTHLEAAITTHQTTAEGLPIPAALSLLQSIEDSLVADTRTLGVWYGHLITPGRFSMRFYAPDGDALRQALEASGAPLPLEFTLADDPEWEHFREF